MNRINIKAFVVLVLSGVLIGCATAPEELGATYVSPLKYKDFTCTRIAVEVPPRVKEASELRYKLDRDTGDDDYGLLLFLDEMIVLG